MRAVARVLRVRNVVGPGIVSHVKRRDRPYIGNRKAYDEICWRYDDISGAKPRREQSLLPIYRNTVLATLRRKCSRRRALLPGEWVDIQHCRTVVGQAPEHGIIVRNI